MIADALPRPTEPIATPESHDLANLQAMLDDPDVKAVLAAAAKENR
jgi:hypothetical protein